VANAFPTSTYLFWFECIKHTKFQKQLDQLSMPVRTFCQTIQRVTTPSSIVARNENLVPSKNVLMRYEPGRARDLCTLRRSEN